MQTRFSRFRKLCSNVKSWFINSFAEKIPFHEKKKIQFRNPCKSTSEAADLQTQTQMSPKELLIWEIFVFSNFYEL